LHVGGAGCTEDLIVGEAGTADRSRDEFASDANGVDEHGETASRSWGFDVLLLHDVCWQCERISLWKWREGKREERDV